MANESQRQESQRVAAAAARVTGGLSQRQSIRRQKSKKNQQRKKAKKAGVQGCKAMMPPKEDPKRQATHVEYETGPIKSSHKRSRIPELLSHKIGQALVTFYESHRKTYEANMVRTRPLVGHDPEPEKILRKKN